MRHFVHMLVGCVLPLFGVGEGVTMLVFVVLMFSCHLFMMRGHQHRASLSRLWNARGSLQVE